MKTTNSKGCSAGGTGPLGPSRSSVPYDFTATGTGVRQGRVWQCQQAGIRLAGLTPPCQEQDATSLRVASTREDPAAATCIVFSCPAAPAAGRGPRSEWRVQIMQAVAGKAGAFGAKFPAQQVSKT